MDLAIMRWLRNGAEGVYPASDMHIIIIIIIIIIRKRRRITLRLLNAIAIPSVVCRLSVCLSVTLARPTQPVEIFGNFFHHTIAQGL